MVEENIQTKIDEMVKKEPVLLFMKGTKHFPQCRFSATVVEVLKRCEAEFATVNVLEDPQIRQGIKEYAKWPTIPQLYIKGEFVGGCDIVREMYQKGELQPLIDGALGTK